MRVEKLVALSLVILFGAASGVYAGPADPKPFVPQVVQKTTVNPALIEELPPRLIIESEAPPPPPPPPMPTARVYGMITLSAHNCSPVDCLPDCTALTVTAGSAVFPKTPGALNLPYLETGTFVHATHGWTNNTCNYSLPLRPGTYSGLSGVTPTNLNFAIVMDAHSDCPQRPACLQPNCTATNFSVKAGDDLQKNFAVKFECF